MAETEKSLEQAIATRRATPSFTGEPMPAEDLQKILNAGLLAPSGYNMQPWRFVVVQHPEQRKRLRSSCYNQAKVEEASVVIVACGDRDGWRKDLEGMIRLGRMGGMPEAYAAQAASTVPNYLSSFNDDQMKGWLNKQVMIAVTSMMWMAEVMGYDTALMEGFEQDSVCQTLRLPMSYWVVSLLAVGRLKGQDKFDGGRFDMSHTVFGEEYGKPLKLR
jgi:nitroreductase